MESTSVNADWTFLQKKPFGFLMAAQTILSFLLIVIPVFSSFIYEGGFFAQSSAGSLFIFSLVMNGLHVFGLNRRTIQMGSAAMFIPCALIIFIASFIFTVCFGFSTLIYVIAFFDSLKYSIRHIFTTTVLLLLVAATTFVCAQLVILLFRAAPNSKITALTTIVIEGEKTEFLQGAAPQFSPTQPYPPSNPQFSV